MIANTGRNATYEYSQGENPPTALLWQKEASDKSEISCKSKMCLSFAQMSMEYQCFALRWSLIWSCPGHFIFHDASFVNLLLSMLLIMFLYCGNANKVMYKKKKSYLTQLLISRMSMHRILPGWKAYWVKYKNISNSDLDGLSLASFWQSRGA